MGGFFSHGHGHSHGPVSAGQAGGGARLAAARKATWLSAWVNLALTVLQIAIGWAANSASLVAHGVHSFSDLLSDFLVLVASQQGANPADEGHPYGHARIETAATLILGASLTLIGVGILWDAGVRLQALADLPAVGWWALWIALLTLLAKEGLFHYLKRVAERWRSQMLLANAWHSRADAASALVVAVGVGGSLMGYGWLDPAAAVIVGFMILRMGIVFVWDSLKELIDTGVDDRLRAAIVADLESVPGAVGVHDVRTRRMAHQILVDAHLVVPGRISVSEGHRIAEAARRAVLERHGDVIDVLVHVDVEEDGPVAEATNDLPERAVVEARLSAALGAWLPSPDRVVLHYLGGRVEAEIHVAAELMTDSARVAALQLAIERLVVEDPSLGAVHLCSRAAPK